MDVKQIQFLGGVVRDVTTQFGLNSNATMFNITVVKEGGGGLAGVPRQAVNFSLGALNIQGYLQSWDEQKVNLAGTGVYSVRATDARPALECVEVLLQAPANGTPGKNVVSIQPKLVDDLEMGTLYTDIVTAVQKAQFTYGSTTFKVSINLPVENRSIGSDAIPYRIRGASMSLVEFLNQVADDNGFEWYCEGTNPVKIKAIVRSSAEVNMEGLASQHTGEVIRLTTGTEAKDEVARTVLYGAPKQMLLYSAGSNWLPYYGLNRDGTDVNAQLTIEDVTKTYRLTTADISKLLNGEKVSENVLPSDMVSKAKDVIDKYVGRQFYKVVASSTTDDNHESWMDVCSAGWWDSDTYPDGLGENARVVFGTDDGRWVSFAKIPEASEIDGKYTEDVTRNDALYVPYYGTAENPVPMNCWYTRVSIERIDLSDSKGNRTKSIWVVTLPFTLTGIKTETTGVGGSATTTTRNIRIIGLDKLWLTMLDHRYAYGPWTSDQLNSKGNKARVVFDSSIAPWTFGYRGIHNTEAMKKMTQVAGARLKTCTSHLDVIDTGELEVAGLPKLNLGAEIGTGTNITNINVNYDVRGIRTLYKCNVYTGELGRYQRYYQDLLDKLRRDADRKARQQDHDALRRELQALKKDIGPTRSNKSGSGGSEYSVVARIEERVDPTFIEQALDPDSLRPPRYKCTIMKEIVEEMGYIAYTPDQVGVVPVTNLGEKAGSPSRLPVGSMVRIRPAVTEQLTNTQGVEVSAVTAWVMEEQAEQPGSLQCRITDSLNPPGTTGGPPLYAVEIVNGNTSPLSSEELDLLTTGVLNIGEPYTSPGYVPLGTLVEVSWTLQNNLTYRPTISHALNIFTVPVEL